MTGLDASAFPPTRHSLVARLGHESDAERRAAFDDLVRAYRPAMLGYLRRRWHLVDADAEDVTQALLLGFWERETLAGFDADRARFRTFLRTCIDRHMINRLRDTRAQRRGGGAEHLALDDDGATAAIEVHSAHAASDDAMHADACFRDEVARTVLARALSRLEAELRERDRSVVFEVLRRYDLEPAPELRYAHIAEALGISVTQVTNHLHAARRRLRALALEEVRAMCGTDDEFRDEARELLGVQPA